MDRNHILILGIGNYLMGDDGIGVHAIEALRKNRMLRGIDIVDGGTKGLELINHFENKKRAIIIDAIDLNRAPGEFILLRGEQITTYLDRIRYSVHEIGLKDLLSTLLLLDMMPDELILIGLQPGKIEAGTTLSNGVKNNLNQLIDRITEIVHA